jgi:hypothetical protein
LLNIPIYTLLSVKISHVGSAVLQKLMQWVGSYDLIQHLFMCIIYITKEPCIFPSVFNCLPSLRRETTHTLLYCTPVIITAVFCLRKFHVLRLARKASNEEKCLSMLPTTELERHVFVSWMSTCENDLVVDGRVWSHFHSKIIFLSRKYKNSVNFLHLWLFSSALQLFGELYIISMKPVCWNFHINEFSVW